MAKTIKNKIVYEENMQNIEGKTLAIVFPESTQEIKNLIKLSEKDILIRANGTSFTGANIPQNSIILDLSKMNKILELNVDKKTIKVEPGLLLSDLNSELEQNNLEMPIIPLFSEVETIGGMLAKNSSGNREIKYGRMINWVDSLEVINGKGEQIKVSKSDLSDFVGMEGITGVIISANLRLTAKKPRTMMILKAENLEDIFSANKKIRLNMDVSAIDLLNKELSLALGLERKYHLLVELENDKGNIKGEEFEKFTKKRNQAYKKASINGYYVLENAKFLIDSLSDFLIYLENNNIPYFSHLASGAVYFLFKLEESKKREETLRLAKKLKGKVAYNFGIGLTHKDFLEPGEKEIIKRVKMRHDPKCKLNTDKVLDSTFESRNRYLPKINELPEPQEPISEIINQNEELSIEQKSENFKDNSQMTIREILLEESEKKTIARNEPQLSDEEREKIKKIAAGFFSGTREEKK